MSKQGLKFNLDFSLSLLLIRFKTSHLSLVIYHSYPIFGWLFKRSLIDLYYKTFFKLSSGT